MSGNVCLNMNESHGNAKNPSIFIALDDCLSSVPCALSCIVEKTRQFTESSQEVLSS